MRDVSRGVEGLSRSEANAQPEYRRAGVVDSAGIDLLLALCRAAEVQGHGWLTTIRSRSTLKDKRRAGAFVRAVAARSFPRIARFTSRALTRRVRFHSGSANDVVTRKSRSARSPRERPGIKQLTWKQL